MKTRFTYLHLFAAVAAIVLSPVNESDAKVINAASCRFADVNNAVLQASPGDTVQLPAGTNWWSQTLDLTNVSLIGAGTNSTMIIDEENRSGSAQVINSYPGAGYFTEIANIQFMGGVTNTSPNYYGAIAVYAATGSSWRIDHNIFNVLYAKNICTYGNAFSVIDNNTFYEKEISVEDNGYVPNDQFGDSSWASPPTYGINSSNVLYVENNTFTNTTTYVASVGACDGENGARIVFRYNTVFSDCFNNHGTETGGRSRSERSFEIYGNTFICPPSEPMYPIFEACLIRGGSGVLFSNTITGYGGLAALRNYRYTCSYYNEWDAFAGANGLSPYDSNDPTLYLTGTSSAPNGSTYLQVNGANWTPNQWYGYTVEDVNNGSFSVITANNANTIDYLGSSITNVGVVACGVLTFNTGDTFQIRRVYAALDQPGRGSGNLLQDEGLGPNSILVTINALTGIASWPNQALDGIYSWGNTVNGAPSGLMSYYPTVQEGRDFYNNKAMPGYTPFVFPHPLESVTAATGSGTYTNQPPDTNQPPSTNGLQPPSNIHQLIP
jgi:hypothetical protein